MARDRTRDLPFPGADTLPTELSGPVEENQTEHDSQDASKKKPKKKPSVNLSDEHEEKMVEWIKDHPLLFSNEHLYKTVTICLWEGSESREGMEGSLNYRCISRAVQTLTKYTEGIQTVQCPR